MYSLTNVLKRWYFYRGGAGMFGLGMPELIIIMVIILLIFGAGKLPEVGGAIGKAIKSFKKSVKEPEEIDITPKNEKDKEKPDQKT